VAVRVALESLAIAVVVAGKVVEEDAAGTVTDDGTLRTLLVFDSVTLAPPPGAGPVRVTVQVELLFGFKLPGRHDNELSVGAGAAVVTVPPVPARVMASPAGDAARLLEMPITALGTPAARVRLTTATMPFAVTVASVPFMMQV